MEILVFNLLSGEFILGQVAQQRNCANVNLHSAFSLSLLLGVLFILTSQKAKTKIRAIYKYTVKDYVWPEGFAL